MNILPLTFPSHSQFSDPKDFSMFYLNSWLQLYELSKQNMTSFATEKLFIYTKLIHCHEWLSIHKLEAQILWSLENMPGKQHVRLRGNNFSAFSPFDKHSHSLVPWLLQGIPNMSARDPSLDKKFLQKLYHNYFTCEIICSPPNTPWPIYSNQTNTIKTSFFLLPQLF